VDPSALEPRTFQPLKAWASAMTVLFVAFGSVNVAVILARWHERQVLLRYDDGEGVSPRDATHLISLMTTLDLLVLLAGLGTIVVMILWWSRAAYRNLEALGAPLRQSHGSAGGGWFIPVANIVLVEMTVDEGRRSADLAAPRDPPWTRLLLSVARYVWPVTYGVGLVLSVLAHGSVNDDPNASPALRANVTELVASSLVIVGVMLAIVSIRGSRPDKTHAPPRWRWKRSD
jgi:uncharacterized membrane protein